MKAGFHKIDITPRIGVGLYGFGPFLNRYSTGIRDNLRARAAVFEYNNKHSVLISCDLIGLQLATTEKIRDIIKNKTGIQPSSVMVCCNHTHSGPATVSSEGWGDIDISYMEILPFKIAQATIGAFEKMKPVKVFHAEAPCEGIGYNREWDKAERKNEEIINGTWKASMPEKTDTHCHVLRFDTTEGMSGFISYFGCHPVICGPANRYIHGDFPGIASNMIEREFPEATGLFLQGALGDINTCAVAVPEPESMPLLDLIASRYANSVKNGLNCASEIKIDCLNMELVSTAFPVMNTSPDELHKFLKEKEELVYRATASDSENDIRMAIVYIRAVSHIINSIDSKLPLSPSTELQGLKIGPVSILASPFQIMHGIKEDVLRKAISPIPLVTCMANDYLGYAPDRSVAEKKGYAASTVPMLLKLLPFNDIHTELVKYLLELDSKLNIENR